MQSKFEDEYQDVLQNIEATIVGIYRENEDLTDYQVDSALEALGRTYQREKIGGAAVRPKNPLANIVYDAVKLACDWRMGREQVIDEEAQPLNMEPISVDEIQACLKRIRKSVEMWNKEHGTRGYLDYIKKFIL